MHKLFLTGALATLCVATGFAQAKLTGFSAAKAGEGVEIQVKGDNLGTPRVVRSQGIYALEFKGKLVGNAKYQKVGYGGVDFVKSVWYRSDLVRVAVKAKRGSDFSFSKNGSGWLLSVNSDAKNLLAKTETKVSQLPAPSTAVAKPLLALNAPAEPVKVAPAKVELKADTNKGETKKVANKDPEVKVTVTKTAPKTTAPKVNAFRETAPVTTYAKPVAYAAKVSLDFVNTDVVQILKALAMQANVNIVTAPEVKGNLTVSLHNVTVSEALDLVTTLAGVRYAKVGKTFVVTSDARFTETMRKIDGSVPTTSETRVVPIYSGEGTQIKAAMLKSAPMEEGVEIVLPSEEVKVEQTDTIGVEPTASADGKNPANDDATTVTTQSANPNSKTKKDDPYVVLIGPSSRLEKFERMIRGIDEQICRAMGIEVPATSSMVRKMYRPKGSTAANLLQALSGEKPSANGLTKARIGTVEAFATPSNSVSDQAIVLYGRETEVNQLLLNLENIDGMGQEGADYLVYDVKFLDPRQLRDELIVQVPGLSASLTSSSAANPVSSGNAAVDAGTAPVTSNQMAGGGGSSGSGEESQGLNAPFKSLEGRSYPMRLVLRGTREQLQRALSYATAVDLAPKQVAIELRVLNLTREEGLRYGLDFGLSGGSGGSFVSVINSDSTINGAVNIARGTILDVSATLDQLSTGTRLIARPNLLATDGRESETFVGNVVRYIKSIQATQNGTTIETGEVPVGVRFAVLPRIGGDGNITLDMRPEVSTLNGFTPVGNGGQLPQTGNRVSQNTVILKDGDTVAIGGLIQDQDVKSVGGVPFLKDLPLIGMLFKRVNNSRVRTETVFFVTARIVNRDNADRAANPTHFTPTSGLSTDKIGK